MRVKIQKWGNSLAVRIPQAFARETRIANNSIVELNLEKDHLVISPVEESDNLELANLLEQVDDDNLHDPVDFGPAEGKESL